MVGKVIKAGMKFLKRNGTTFFPVCSVPLDLTQRSGDADCLRRGIGKTFEGTFKASVIAKLSGTIVFVC